MPRHPDLANDIREEREMQTIYKRAPHGNAAPNECEDEGIRCFCVLLKMFCKLSSCCHAILECLSDHAHSLSPVIIDRMQGIGPETTNMYDRRLTWTTDYDNKKVLTATHRLQNGAPSGGNFGFEDGHVQWVNGKGVSLGAAIGSWMCFFRIPISEP